MQFIHVRLPRSTGEQHSLSPFRFLFVNFLVLLIAAFLFPLSSGQLPWGGPIYSVQSVP